MKKIISTKSATPIKVKEVDRKKQYQTLFLTFFVPILGISALLFLLISYRGGIEAGLANLAGLLPFGYAFGAGMVASANPCGILLLPSYVTYQMQDLGLKGNAGRRLILSLSIAFFVTLGFTLVFVSIGLLIFFSGNWILPLFPYFGLLIAVTMTVLGVWILASNKTISILDPKMFQVKPRQNVWNAFVFGLTYALGSLSCTLPIFLVVVGVSFSGDSIISSIGNFLSYSLGMGLIILFVTTGTALFRRMMAKWLRSITPHIHRLSALFLIGAGVYLLYYWLFIQGL